MTPANPRKIQSAAPTLHFQRTPRVQHDEGCLSFGCHDRDFYRWPARHPAEDVIPAQKPMTPSAKQCPGGGNKVLSVCNCIYITHTHNW
jgi:hypothetical protein